MRYVVLQLPVVDVYAIIWDSTSATYEAIYLPVPRLNNFDCVSHRFQVTKVTRYALKVATRYRLSQSFESAAGEIRAGIQKDDFATELSGIACCHYARSGRRFADNKYPAARVW
eukprot:CAMPEP_0113582104 /NCGR_PEP_ID=MMETSP0015_2-20120614/31707_1 /TAXON_ID=2838 /ORGANISM="Odontella" /LENGTH=113 /DNA_ID=CAMNT_0000486695 /DNA_START=414 /DNA_END=752 /DNA_ORIENTATION=+ /assembly_acc=CAM_ASM_000160